MSRKDYELIAAAIREQVEFYAGDPIAQHVVKATAQRLSVALAHTNDRFDRVRFLRACGF